MIILRYEKYFMQNNGMVNCTSGGFFNNNNNNNINEHITNAKYNYTPPIYSQTPNTPVGPERPILWFGNRVVYAIVTRPVLLAMPQWRGRG